MHKAQQNFLNYLSGVESIIQKVQTTGLDLNVDTKPVEHLKTDIQTRELLVPVVGAFSAGKSSLLNAIVGKEVLPVALPPETAIPAELRYDSHERLEAIFTDGRIKEYELKDFPSLQKQAPELDYVRLYINSLTLKNLVPLVLVDMPGFNSPLDVHNKAIAQYIGEGAHYLFVVSVEEGTLHSTSLRYINDIANLGRSFSVCINKADLYPAAEVENIRANITQRLEDERLSAKVCAVNQKKAESVQTLLKDIDPDALFADLFLLPLEQEHSRLEGILETAHHGLQADKAENDKRIIEMENVLRELIQERDQKTQSFSETDLGTAADDVLSSIRNRLNRSVDSMAQAFLSGRQEDVTRIVSDEARSGLIEGARRVTNSISSQLVHDFSLRVTNGLRPEIALSAGWTDGLLQQLESELLPLLLSNLGGSKSTVGKTSSVSLGLGALSAVGSLVPQPILKVVLAILPNLLGSLFGWVNEGQKLEQIKEAIRTQVLPNIERGLHPEVSSFLSHAQQEALKRVADSFEDQITQQKNALEQIRQNPQASNNEAFIASLQNALSELKALGQAHL